MSLGTLIICISYHVSRDDTKLSTTTATYSIPWLTLNLCRSHVLGGGEELHSCCWKWPLYYGHSSHYSDNVMKDLASYILSRPVLSYLIPYLALSLLTLPACLAFPVVNVLPSSFLPSFLSLSCSVWSSICRGGWRRLTDYVVEACNWESQISQDYRLPPSSDL